MLPPSSCLFVYLGLLNKANLDTKCRSRGNQPRLNQDWDSTQRPKKMHTGNCPVVAI
jgi:hypothetical protein